MALQVSLTIHSTRVPENPDEVVAPLGIYPEAYARIVAIRVHPQITYFVVVWHENQAARERDEQPVLVREFFADTTSLPGDVYPAAYAYLKTLPEFEGATDV